MQPCQPLAASVGAVSVGLDRRQLDLVCRPLERLDGALDAIGETTFALDRQPRGDLVDAARGAVFDRRL